MKLIDCLETAYACGLDNIGEAYNNIMLHQPFIYEEANREMQELVNEIEEKGLKFSDLVLDHLPLANKEKIDKDMNEYLM